MASNNISFYWVISRKTSSKRPDDAMKFNLVRYTTFAILDKILPIFYLVRIYSDFIGIKFYLIQLYGIGYVSQ